jgi:hypothetical protein
MRAPTSIGAMRRASIPLPIWAGHRRSNAADSAVINDIQCTTRRASWNKRRTTADALAQARPPEPSLLLVSGELASIVADRYPCQGPVQVITLNRAQPRQFHPLVVLSDLTLDLLVRVRIHTTGCRRRG